jgi:hypothetical protein
MTRSLEIAGQRFNHWTVVERDRSGAGRSGTQAVWLCDCDCGTRRTVSSWRLRNGWSKSCGCFRRNWKKLPAGLSSAHALYGTYRKNARARNLPITITRDEFLRMTQECCYYCSSPPTGSYQNSIYANGAYTYNGLDRVDNARGYEIDNVVPCCYSCNDMKGKRSSAEFIERCRRVAAFAT